MKKLFLTSASDNVMYDIIKHLPEKPENLKIAFINTAAEVEEGEHWWVDNERNKLLELGFNLEEFTITNITKEKFENKLQDKQILYFCGGNTFHLLNQILKTGIDEIIKKKLEEGLIYIGSSAGSMIAGIRIDLVSTEQERSVAPDLKTMGLNIIDIALLPHWGSGDLRDEYIGNAEEIYNANIKVVTLRDNQYLKISGETMQLIQV